MLCVLPLALLSTPTHPAAPPHIETRVSAGLVEVSNLFKLAFNRDIEIGPGLTLFLLSVLLQVPITVVHMIIPAGTSSAFPSDEEGDEEAATAYDSAMATNEAV